MRGGITLKKKSLVLSLSLVLIATTSVAIALTQNSGKVLETDDIIVINSSEEGSHMFTFEAKTEQGEEMTVYDILKSTEEIRNPEGIKAVKFYEKEPTDEKEAVLFDAIKNAKELSSEMNTIHFILADPDSGITEINRDKLKDRMKELSEQIQVYTEIIRRHYNEDGSYEDGAYN